MPAAASPITAWLFTIYENIISRGFLDFIRYDSWRERERERNVKSREWGRTRSKVLKRGVRPVAAMAQTLVSVHDAVFKAKPVDISNEPFFKKCGFSHNHYCQKELIIMQ